MWIDVSAAIFHMQESELRPALSCMTENNRAKIAEIAEIAGHVAQKAKPAKAAQADGFGQDDGAFLDYLHVHGASTYGAIATTLGLGATRAWQAEARLRAAGLVRLDSAGRLHPVPFQAAK